MLHGNLVGDPERLDRFFRGARRMAELDHPCVARVLERRAEDGGYQYFVMELLTGGDLRQAVLEKRIAAERIAAVVLGVGEALAHAHAKWLVHRDVKPANVLLDAAGAPRLTDFDLVWSADTTGGRGPGRSVPSSTPRPRSSIASTTPGRAPTSTAWG